MKIGELAKRSGLSAHTLRFYERSGILTASGRSENNYRYYTELDLAKATFIKHARTMSFSLEEVQLFLSIRANKSAHACSQAKLIAEQKIISVNNKIKELQQTVKALNKLSDACCGGSESAVNCTILETLENNKKD